MDYKATLNLPKTDFPMKADLPKREPEMIKAWEEKGLYREITQEGKNRKPYILHDGPPYANGRIHMGHALNKILKDIVVRSRFMTGFGTYFVPGWDCHGLPIELQVEKELAKKKEEVSKVEIRKRCRAYAERFVDIQRGEFKRLGVFGDWARPYLTMDFSYQASIMRELGKFVKNGLVYKGKKPVHWCASCRTALAEAEVEYNEKTSPSVYVKFELDPQELSKRTGIDKPGRAFIVIWTTTPWTLPANLAVALNPEFEYSIVSVDGEVFVVASGLLDDLKERFGWGNRAKVIKKVSFNVLEGMKARHPFIERESVILPADFVTLEAGTGCVHIAPGHGQEDYELGLAHGLDIYAPVDNHGRFTREVPEFEGEHVFKANPGIVKLLEDRGMLLKREEISHTYPHCWRCKNPVIFRATEQWFVSMEKGELRKRALEAIEKVQWIPSWGRERIYSMVQNRPDWCLSRQRAWGVPIPSLFCKGCSRAFIDIRVIERLAELFEQEGADVWFEKDIHELMPEGVSCPECGGGELEKEEDILDVWFDSGVSFAAVLEKREGLGFPADLYLEGSDQHRGWFQSSLLSAIGTRQRPPYRAVLTHGFVVDGEGRKMSKSLGNVISPQEVIDRYGAEVLRLWVAGEDYREDIRISSEILKRLSEAYRRIRNTFRYILGNLYDFNPSTDTVPYEKLRELDRLTLHRLAKLGRRVLKAYNDFEFHIIYHSVHNFCAVDLSSFYLDVLKDRLYTSKTDSLERKAAQTTIYHVLDHLVRLTAPILVFTSDEAWSFMPGRSERSVHLAGMPETPEKWLNDELEERWQKLLKVKAEVSKALEVARQKERIIGHSLDAMVTIYPPSEIGDFLREEEEALREVLIVSALKVEGARKPEGTEGVVIFESSEIPGLSVTVERASGGKCERCWHYSESVGTDAEHPTICKRCSGVLT